MPLPEARFNHFNVRHAGRLWSGEWRLIGKDVMVSGAYGSMSRAVGRRRPEAVAEELLKGCVDGWRARRPG